MNKKGFTLVELLVVTAVIGILGILSATLISSILRSQNKTAIINEVRQNGDLVISKFERDVKQSEAVTGGGTSVTLKTYNGGTINWVCYPAPLASPLPLPPAGDFTRNAQPIINTDQDNGVWVSQCSFSVSPATHTSGKTQIVTLNFTLEQRSTVQRAEYQIREQFQVTAGTRAY